jgi:hypothetical protein
MADNNQGHCKGCRYFGTHHSNPGDDEVAPCHQPHLEDFDLSVSGASGCNAYEARADADLPRGVEREDPMVTLQ